MLKLEKRSGLIYDDIIHLPHPTSNHHPQMSIADRAAQFSPFAALTGYDGAIKETARLTDQRIDLEDSAQAILNEKLRILQEQVGSQAETEVVFFCPDELKTGGSYLSKRGIVKKIEGYNRTILMQDDTKIPIDDIIDLTGELFRSMPDF